MPQPEHRADALGGTRGGCCDPPETTLAAHDAGPAARKPYQQTEVYRFGNAVVNHFEGTRNACYLNEGPIDYVDAFYSGPSDTNELALNMIASPSITIGGAAIGASRIAPEVIAAERGRRDRDERGTNYNAIEFPALGQDPNGTGPGAGKRGAMPRARR